MSGADTLLVGSTFVTEGHVAGSVASVGPVALLASVSCCALVSCASCCDALALELSVRSAGGVGSVGAVVTARRKVGLSESGVAASGGTVVMSAVSVASVSGSTVVSKGSCMWSKGVRCHGSVNAGWWCVVSAV